MKKNFLYVFVIILLNKYVLNTDHIPDTELDIVDKMVSNISKISFHIQINRKKIIAFYSNCYERNI